MSGENIKLKEREIENLKLRHSFSLNSFIDKDGDEVNEDGLKFIEIREMEDEYGNLIPDEHGITYIYIYIFSKYRIWCLIIFLISS